MSGSRLAELVNPWSLLTSVSSCGSYVRASLIMLEDPGETCCGGWNVFHDPSKVLPKFTPNFTIFSRKTKAPRRWDPGNRVRTSSEGPRRQKSVFLSSYFCFSPKSQLLNDFGTRKSIKTRKYFLKWRKTQNKKVVSSFLIFRAKFFFRSRITRKLEEIERFWAKN